MMHIRVGCLENINVEICRREKEWQKVSYQVLV